MITDIIWLMAVTLEVVILVRGFFVGTVRHYPYFYSYIGYVLVQDIFRMSIYIGYPHLYPPVYWSTQFLGLILGCGLLWEIYRLALAPFPGAQRVARYVFGVIALALFVKALSGIGRLNWPISTTLDLERDLRFIQAGALSALLSVFAFYSLSLGRNLQALILGYGIFLATSVISLAVRARLGDRFQLWLVYLQPSLYIMVLCIWGGGLWNYVATQRPARVLQMAQDYERLVSSTRSRLSELRSHLNRGIKA